MRLPLILLVFLFCTSGVSKAQRILKNLDFRFKTDKNVVIDDSEFLRREGITSNLSYNLGVLGKSKKNILAYQGIAISYNRISKSSDIGNPWSFSYLLGLSLADFKSVKLVLENELGMTHGWKKFDKLSNPQNLNFSTNTTLNYAVSLNGVIKLSPSINLLSSVGFRHYSNGSLKRPNHGLNTFGYSLGLGWSFLNSSVDEQKNIILPETDFKTVLVLGIGSKQPLFITVAEQSELSKYQNINYLQLSFRGVHLRKLINRHFLGVGLDISYDPTVDLLVVLDEKGQLLKVEKTDFLGSLKLGSLLAYHHDLGAIELLIHQGYYIIGEVDFGGRWYQRYGLSYDVGKHLLLGFSVRSAGFPRSDWLEFSFGHSW